MASRTRWLVVTISVLVALVAILAVVAIPWWKAHQSGPTSGFPPGVPIRSITDLSGAMGGAFRPGAVQGFGSNNTTVLLGGIGIFDEPTDFSLPVLSSLGGVPGQGPGRNLTASVEPYFHEGGVFEPAWNGSAWLITGQATWGARNQGTLAELQGSQFRNVTSLVEPYFVDQGIWIDGWNGTAWLIGGNTTNGAALVGLQGNRVTDYTPLLPHNTPGSWVQMAAWNGSAWVVGGLHVFGILEGSHYTDLLSQAPFAISGALAADWNGSAWLVGGGPPASTVVVRGTTVYPGPTLPNGFQSWINGIVAADGGWLLAGQWNETELGITPALAWWDSVDGHAAVDLTRWLPSSFGAGQVQLAGWASAFGRGAILLIGLGLYQEPSGLSQGAVGLVMVDTPA